MKWRSRQNQSILKYKQLVNDEEYKSLCGKRCPLQV